MNPKDLTKEALNSSTLGLHEFIILHTKFETDLFCFYEGKDSQYYFPRINQYFGKNHHPIVCGNKKAVIETSKLVLSKYKKYKVAFFIDNDFDNEKYESIYITPCYSIENLYCTKNVLSLILKNEFNLKETDKEYDDILKIFENNLNIFNQAVKLFNLWYATAKSKAKKLKKIVNVSLNDKFPKDFATIKIDNIIFNYTIDDIQNKFPDALIVNQEEIDDFIKTFDLSNPSMVFRGKYQIEFFYLFLRYIIEDANKNKKILKNKTKFNIDSSQILSQISQYSETPYCLIEYIKEISGAA